jgi:hypothetical protein
MWSSQIQLSSSPAIRVCLHDDLGVPENRPIPEADLEDAKKSASPAVRRRATFAINAKGFKH